MVMQLPGNSALLSAGALGLGAATATMLVPRGMRAVIANVQDAAGQVLAAAIGAQFVHGDVTSKADVQIAVHAAQALVLLRVAVNCVGIAPAARTLGKQGPHALDLFERVIRIHLIGSFNLARLAAAVIAQQAPLIDGERGVIIHMASVAAFDDQIEQVASAASKAGIVGMTLLLARDLWRDGIRVMASALGIFKTPMLMGMPTKVQTALAQMVLFSQHPGKPQEYAALVEAILTNPMLNGEVIRLDGAIRMQPQ